MTDRTKDRDVRLRSPDRSQVKMQIGCDDELIAADHPARLVWRVSGELDLSAFYASIKSREGVCGRDATHPRLLFCLWLYATLRGVGSARELARLCGESAPYRWLCGGVSVNHHTLSDFRVGQGAALNELFTQVLASLVDKKLVKVCRISQDGTRVRACAGSNSFRREERLNHLLQEAQKHVVELKELLDKPAGNGGLSARRKAALRRAAREREDRVRRAIDQLPQLKQRREKRIKKAGNGEQGQKLKRREPRASTSDAEARVMKVADGGYRPAYNIQLAVDTDSRAIVGVTISNEGSDGANLAEPMRQQVEQRTGQAVKEHLMDGGYTVLGDVERAQEQGVTLYTPPKPSRNKEKREDEFKPLPTDSAAVAAWRVRMGTPEAQEIYKQRGSTVETVNADLKEYRGLQRFLVKGMKKALSIVLWSALAYNLMHFGSALLG